MSSALEKITTQMLHEGFILKPEEEGLAGFESRLEDMWMDGEFSLNEENLTLTWQRQVYGITPNCLACLSALFKLQRNYLRPIHGRLILSTAFPEREMQPQLRDQFKCLADHGIRKDVLWGDSPKGYYALNIPFLLQNS